MADNYIDIINGVPVETRLYLCLVNEATIAELNTAYNRQHTLNYGGLNQLVFRIPYDIPDSNNEYVRNPLVDLINGDYLVRLEQKDVIEYYVITTPINDMQDGKKYMEVKCNFRPIVLKDKELVNYNVAAKKLYDPSGIDSLLHETLLAKTEWAVGYVDSDLALQRRSFNVTHQDLLTFLNDVANSYNAIIAFDSVHKTVSFYKEENYGIDEGLVIDESRLKSITETENHLDVVTRLYAFGANNMTFASVNPTSAPWVDDFSFYMYPFAMDGSGNVTSHSQYMSDDLCKAITIYNQLSDSKSGQFGTLLTQRKSLINSLIPLDVILTQYKADMDSIKAQIDVAIKTGNSLTALNSQKAAKLSQIQSNQSSYNAINFQIDSVRSTITVTSGATSNGNITLTFDSNTAITIALSSGDSVNTVASKINNAIMALYPAYANEVYAILSPTYNSSVSTNVVTVDYNTTKSKNDTSIVFAANSTGVALTIAKSDYGVDNQMSTLQNTLSTSSNFTSAQLAELRQYIKERTWSDSKYVDPNDLFRDAKARLSQISQPIMAYNIDSVNFTRAINTPNDWYRLKIGAIVTVVYPDFGINFDIKVKAKLNHYASKKLKAKIVAITNYLDDYKIQIIIANHKNFNNGFLKLGDLLKNSTNYNSILDFSRQYWDLSKNNNDIITQVINNQYDATKQAVVGGVNENIIIDKTGITAKDPNNPNKMVRILHDVIAMTSDGGNTYKTGITSSGVVAETLYGKIIIGNNLTLGDPDGIINIAGNKVTVKDRSLNDVMKMGLYESVAVEGADKFGLKLFNGVNQVIMDRDSGFIIKRKNGANFDNVFYADSNGNLFANTLTLATPIINNGSITGTSINVNNRFTVDGVGNMTATSATITGNISGSNITGSTIIGGSITSNTDINVTRDITLGSNLYLTNATNSSRQSIVAPGGSSIDFQGGLMSLSAASQVDVAVGYFSYKSSEVATHDWVNTSAVIKFI